MRECHRPEGLRHPSQNEIPRMRADVAAETCSRHRDTLLVRYL